MSQRTSRREFLKRTAGAGLCAAGLAELASAKSPNSKIQHAAIGVGGKGWSDVMAFASHPRVVVTALCDVDTARMARAAKRFPKARRYQVLIRQRWSRDRASRCQTRVGVCRVAPSSDRRWRYASD